MTIEALKKMGRLAQIGVCRELLASRDVSVMARTHAGVGLLH